MYGNGSFFYFKIFSMSSADTEMKDAETALSEEVMQMSTEDLVARTRLIDNECKMMRSGYFEILVQRG